MERLFRLIEENAEITDRAGAPPLVARGAEVRFEHVDFAYEPNRADPARRDVRDPGRAQRRGRRSLGLGQIDARAAPLSLLRRRRRPHHDRRPGHSRRPAGEPARGDRHRSAGHGAVQRHDRIQHRVRPPGCDARRDRRRRRSSRRSTISSRACRKVTRRRSASAASSCPAARSSASQSRARYSRHPAILIFDEATSALDSRSEKAIQAELRIDRARPHVADDRASAVDDRRRRRDPRARPRPHRRAGHACCAACMPMASMPACGGCSRTSGARHPRPRSPAIARRRNRGHCLD